MSRNMQFSEDQIAEFQETFLLYDQRGDGKIPVSQIGSKNKSSRCAYFQLTSCWIFDRSDIGL